MDTRRAKHCFDLCIGALLTCVILIACRSMALAADAPATQPGAPAGNPRTIVALSNPDCTVKCKKQLVLAMGDNLAVKLDNTGELNAADWTLYLNGMAVLDPSDTPTAPPGTHTLIFKLRRSDSTKADWQKILGSPSFSSTPVTVSVVTVDGKTKVEGDPKTGNARFSINVLRTWWLLFAGLLAALATFAMFALSWKTAIVRDNLLPQIPVLERPFSLGRVQMAIWFAIVLDSVLFLWVLLWDYNTVTSQALTLMGIAAATGAGALCANLTNNDALKAADASLQAQGFTSSVDIETARRQLANAPNDSALQAKIKAFNDATSDYVSGAYDPDAKKVNLFGVITDLIDDKDGPALHRLQVLGWTLALAAVFIVGLYRDLAMPEFSTTLLALMGVSGASYVGFKFPEAT